MNTGRAVPGVSSMLFVPMQALLVQEIHWMPIHVSTTTVYSMWGVRLRECCTPAHNIVYVYCRYPSWSKLHWVSMRRTLAVPSRIIARTGTAFPSMIGAATPKQVRGWMATPECVAHRYILYTTSIRVDWCYFNGGDLLSYIFIPWEALGRMIFILLGILECSSSFVCTMFTGIYAHVLR